MIVETDASKIVYGEILKQKLPASSQESIVSFHSGVWLGPQKKLFHRQKEVLSIVNCISKFQDGLINKMFLLSVDRKSAKKILQKDVKNLVSKQIFARWQAILSVFDFDIQYIQGKNNSLPDFLRVNIYREKLQIFNNIFKMSDSKSKKPMTASGIKNERHLQGKPLTTQNPFSVLAEFPPLSYSREVTTDKS